LITKELAFLDPSYGPGQRSKAVQKRTV